MAAPRWTDLSVLKARLGITVLTYDVALTQVLAGVESTITQAVRSPVRLKFEQEWRAPVDDFRLILRWRPVNVLSVSDGTTNPTVTVTNWPAYDASNGTALTFGIDFTVYNLDSGDPRFAVAGMLEAINGGNGGVGSWWCGGGTFSGQWSYPPTRLAPTRGEARGRLWVTYWAGWPADAIPAALAEAAYLEAAARWSIRKIGRLLSSEHLDEYGYNTVPLAPPVPGVSTKFVSQAAAEMLQEWIAPAIAGPGIW